MKSMSPALKAHQQDLYEDAIPREMLWWIALFLNSAGIRESLEDQIEQIMRTDIHDVGTLRQDRYDPSLAGLGSILAALGTMRIPLSLDRQVCLAYLETPEIRSSLRAIDQYCALNVPLRDEVKDIMRKRYAQAALVQSVADILRHEHIEVKWDILRSVLTGKRKPRTTAGKVTCNYVGALRDADDFPTEEWSVSDIERLWLRLHKGTRLWRSPPFRTPEDTELIASLCLYVNVSRALRRQHPIIVAYFLMFTIMSQRPFREHNTFMARLLFQIAALQNGHEIVALLPLRLPAEALQRGPEIKEELEEHRKVSTTHLRRARTNIDMTAPLASWLGDLANKLEAHYTRSEKLERFTQVLTYFLAAHDFFNSRQNKMIARALRSPGTTFRISYHQKRHNLGYATAYRDFQELVDAQIFTFQKRSNPTIYRAVPDLEKRIASLRQQTEKLA